jgi:hypothetical protein
VSLSSASQFRRDAQIIRDFIIGIGKINQRCITNKVNVRETPNNVGVGDGWAVEA